MSTQIPQTPAGVNALLDHLVKRAQLKNDAALSRALGVAPPVVSKLRSAKIPLGAMTLLNIHLSFDVPVRDIMLMVAQETRVAAA